jgi:hypothetical protein
MSPDLKDAVLVGAFILFTILSSSLIVYFLSPKKEKKNLSINNKIKKEEAKVVDFVNCGEIENLAQFKDGKLVMCRCWRSEVIYIF